MTKRFFVILWLAFASVSLASQWEHCPKGYKPNESDLWGEQCEAWSNCKAPNQSPVDITTERIQGMKFPKLTDVSVTNRNVNISIYNTGKSLKIPLSQEDTTFDFSFLNGFTFANLKELRFVTPSEHSIDGEFYDLELQLRFQPSNGDSSVNLAIMFNLGETNQFFESFSFFLPQFSHCSCGNGRIEPWTGEECDNGKDNSEAADQCSLDCKLPRCGDDVTDTCEDCDAGDALNSNLPNAPCRPGCILPACGDGIVDTRLGEQCDDGNIFNRDGCSSRCTWECGDGELDTVGRGGYSEQCDDGDANSNTLANACRTQLRGIPAMLTCLRAYCGDGITDLGEECDEGTAGNGQTGANLCRTNCTLPYCGDGIVDPGEQCDFGINNDNPLYSCNSTCFSLCGDGILQPFGEECDEGTGNNSLAPNALCRPNCDLPRCGDLILDTLNNETRLYYLVNESYPDAALFGMFDEECEGPAPWCIGCRVACGNGRLEGNEQCDLSINYNGLGQFLCNDDCTAPFCGDGILNQVHEECDTLQNGDVPNRPCRSNCQVQMCGDGITDPLFGEECDDGNEIAEDGCDPLCKWECGNGKLGRLANEGASAPAGFEECDMGEHNGNIADHCRATTDINPNTGKNLRRCTMPYCGDGVKDWGEICDAGLLNSNTRPNSPCRLDCTLPYCGDGVVDSTEQCDMGAMNNDAPFSGSHPGTVEEQEASCSRECSWNRCRVSHSSAEHPGFELDLTLIQPKSGWGSYLSYFGSLTEPPCTPSTWLVYPEAHSISPYQLRHFRRVQGIHEEGRPIQRTLRGIPPSARLPEAPGMCGDGVVQAGEECDDGIRNNDHTSNACRTDCRNPHCGDGVVDKDEECDLGNPLNKQCMECKLPIRTSYPTKWTYERAQFWGGLCHTGEEQSPIDLVASPSLSFVDTHALHGAVHYHQAIPIQAYNTEKNVIFKAETGSQNQFRWMGIDYDLTSIEIHSPSEHHINGKVSDFELVYMHTNTTAGKDLAVSVLYNIGETRNKYLDAFWFFIPLVDGGQCGNGRIDEGEQCDCGEENSDLLPDKCRTNCMKPSCGDGVVDFAEKCDWGFDRNSNVQDGACRSDCRLPGCGDGVIDRSLGEECEPGVSIHCSPICTNTCGNGIVEGAEECDYGNMNNDYWPAQNATARVCRTNCFWSRCGDGVTDFNEECDHVGNSEQGCVSASSTERTPCTFPRCGDGVVDFHLGEECDDIADPACNSAICKWRCGDGNVDPGEECDAGALNAWEPNRCRPTCTVPTCGDFILDEGEECDSVPNSDGKPVVCGGDCKLRCGNGELDAGEDCDWGTLNNDHIAGCCRTSCLEAGCGDGVIDYALGEECDVGDAEAPWCVGCRLTVPEPSSLCGNFMKDDGEFCDNGDFNSDTEPNACRRNCRLASCGDGVTDSGEECDGGNKCRSDCTRPFCGDDTTDPLFGEECDRGMGNSDSDWNGCSTECKLNVNRQCTTSVSTIPVDQAYPSLTPHSGVFVYEGSMTQPPCTEGVTRIVFEEIQTIHRYHAEAYRRAVPKPNSRGLQSNFHRQVMYPREEPMCGNCRREGIEECDEGSRNSDRRDGACRTNCIRAHCGDGVVDVSLGEQCDSQVGCDLTCHWTRECPAGKCPKSGCETGRCVRRGDMVPQDGTVINVNFAGALSKN